MTAAGVLLLTAGGAVAATLGLRGGDSGGETAGTLPPGTAKVTRETLTDSRSADGRLGYGPSRSVTGRVPGTLTWLPDAGREITRGRALYEVDDRPVVLMYGSMPAYRPMRTGTEGPDVEQLEENLGALGYTGFTVDETYTDATADAVRQWQEDRGLQQTGTVELGRVVFASGAVRVDSLDASEGDATGGGTGGGDGVLAVTGTAKAVTVELDTADQRLVKEGARAGITLPDGQEITGRVDSVTTVIEGGGREGEEATTKVEVIVAMEGRKAQRAADDYALASVDVSFTAGERENVLTVPVAALVALEEGGFGVEVVRGSTARYVPVTTGLFTDGRVEISGRGIAEGTTVGMPK
ncbi:peptidoglycan-binding protein [Streptomyces sp. NPDC018031]|uniref:peptidoglycan-binding protein n=1 Tax=Streptomyces sp. NPDC018031 TaxID=3365033 RepID=UPI0037B7AD22